MCKGFPDFQCVRILTFLYVQLVWSRVERSVTVAAFFISKYCFLWIFDLTLFQFVSVIEFTSVLWCRYRVLIIVFMSDSGNTWQPHHSLAFCIFTFVWTIEEKTVHVNTTQIIQSWYVVNRSCKDVSYQHNLTHGIRNNR